MSQGTRKRYNFAQRNKVALLEVRIPGTFFVSYIPKERKEPRTDRD
jgi:hypothetical protein